MDKSMFDFYMQAFQVVGWPGVFAFAAWRIWTWYTTVRWPQERQDRIEAAKIERDEKSRWYQQMHDLILQIQKVYLILAAVHPEHAIAVDQSFNGDKK